ncbi:MAG: glycosyltransferase family 4 protein [Candidatus Binatia bacterium]
MRIAQVSPLYESVPPKYYGGTERIVSCLTEELVRQGHEVTLFASGDSVTSANLVSACQYALRLNPDYDDPILYHVLQIEQVAKVANEFDIIHFHLSYLHYTLTRRMMTPSFTTLHGRLDLPDLVALYREFSEVPVVSISDSQRAPRPWLNWQGTVHHGLPEELYSLRHEPGGYLAFLGRFSPEKRIDRAIEIARKSGMPLKIAAKIDNADLEYYKSRVEPMLKDPLIEYVGEIGEAEKQEFLGNAYAHLFPIDWPEPFGIVMIEAMACGTPTIAFRCGSVPEVLDDGATGFVVDTIEEAVESVGRVAGLNRENCRRIFERRFSASRMVQDYVKIYDRLQSEIPTFNPTESAAFDR